MGLRLRQAVLRNARIAGELDRLLREMRVPQRMPAGPPGIRSLGF